MSRRLAPGIEAAIQQAAQQHGIDPVMLRTFVLIESGGNPNNVTGSYRGLLQLSPQEFAQHGGTGDIFDPAANLSAGARKLRAEMAQFQQSYGRPPNAWEIYLIHQQGVGGAAAHMANPDAPAWQNMAGTAEGRMRGPQWAQQAIWGNVPTDARGQFGDVNNITSRDFMRLWEQRVARFGGGTTQGTQAADPAPHDPASAPPADQSSPAGQGASPTSVLGVGAPAVAQAAPASPAPSAAPAAQPPQQQPFSLLGALGLAPQAAAPTAGTSTGLIGNLGLTGGAPFSISGSNGSSQQAQQAAAAATPPQLNLVGKPIDMQRLLSVVSRRSQLGLG